MQRAHKRYTHKNMLCYIINVDVAGTRTGSVSCNLKYRFTKWLWLIFKAPSELISNVAGFIHNPSLHVWTVSFPFIFFYITIIFYFPLLFGFLKHMRFLLKKPYCRNCYIHSCSVRVCLRWAQSSRFPLRHREDHRETQLTSSPAAT